MIKIKNFRYEQLSKILQRYIKYYDNNNLVWKIPQHEMKNIVAETWDLSKILTKHQKELKPSEQLIELKKEIIEDLEIYSNKMYELEKSLSNYIEGLIEKYKEK